MRGLPPGFLVPQGRAIGRMPAPPARKAPINAQFLDKLAVDPPEAMQDPIEQKSPASIPLYKFSQSISAAWLLPQAVHRNDIYNLTSGSREPGGTSKHFRGAELCLQPFGITLVREYASEKPGENSDKMLQMELIDIVDWLCIDSRRPSDRVQLKEALPVDRACCRRPVPHSDRADHGRAIGAFS